MSDTLILEILRDTLKAITRLAHGNKVAVSGICGDAMRKIDAAIGPAPQRGQAPPPIQQPQSSYNPLSGDELYRQQHARMEADREARVAKQLEQIRRRQGNGIQPMPHGQADDFADER